MSNEKENKGPSFPAGTFRFIAEWESVKFGPAENGQSMRICVRLVCQNDEPDVRGKGILWFGGFANQQNTDITLQALEIMGADPKAPMGKPGGPDGALAGLGGTEFEALIVHKEFEGKTRAEVKYINAIGGGFSFKKEATSDDMARLNEQVRKHRQATAPATRAVTRTPQVRTPPPADARAFAQGTAQQSAQVQRPAMATPTPTTQIAPEVMPVTGRPVDEHDDPNDDEIPF